MDNREFPAWTILRYSVPAMSQLANANAMQLRNMNGPNFWSPGYDWNQMTTGNLIPQASAGGMFNTAYSPVNTMEGNLNPFAGPRNIAQQSPLLQVPVRNDIQLQYNKSAPKSLYVPSSKPQKQA